jgi:hypothetical protein
LDHGRCAASARFTPSIVRSVLLVGPAKEVAGIEIPGSVAPPEVFRMAGPRTFRLL